MNVLAIDTASSCSAAVWRDGRIAAKRHRAIARGHAETLMPMVEEVLDEAGLRFAALDLIAAAIGPGSFTGLRTGLAAARGLALALGRPTFGVTSLEAVAQLVPLGSTLLVALETKREDIYIQLFSPTREPLTEPMVCLPDRIPALLPSGPILVAGDAAARLLKVMHAEFFDTPTGDAAVIATIAASRFRPGATFPALTPLYLAPPQAKPRIDGGAVRP
jgi:tRNA threonylcarbamoyladenosine biosynthesis protein TsaB